jgi:hypothetical protein
MQLVEKLRAHNLDLPSNREMLTAEKLVKQYATGYAYGYKQGKHNTRNTTLKFLDRKGHVTVAAQLIELWKKV